MILQDYKIKKRAELKKDGLSKITRGLLLLLLSTSNKKIYIIYTTERGFEQQGCNNNKKKLIGLDGLNTQRIFFFFNNI